MQLRILAFTFAVLLSAPFAFAGTLAPGGGPTTGVLDANSNVGTTLATTLAGERLANQSTNSYLAVRNEANVSIISKTAAVTIGGGLAGDTHLLGLHIAAALTGTCVLTGFGDSDGTAQSYTLPAATPAGYKDFLGAKNSAGALTITCSNASDDNLVMVLWRPAL